MLPQGVPYRSESGSASASTASPRLEVTQRLGRSAALRSRLPTLAGSSSIHPATPAADCAVRITEPVESTQPRRSRSPCHVLMRLARAAGGRRASARRAAEAGDAFDWHVASRAAKRARRTVSRTSALPVLTYPRQNSSTNETLLSYTRLMADFLTIRGTEGSPHRVKKANNREMDTVREHYMEEVFKRAELGQCGSNLIALLKFVNPIFGKNGTLTLPPASHVPRVWRSEAPGTTRFPLPWDVVCPSALQQVHMGMFTTAQYTMLCSSVHPPPSEPCSTNNKQIVGPVLGTRHKCKSVILHTWEVGRVGQTLLSNETRLIDLDEYQFLATALRALKSVTPDAEYASQFSHAQAPDRFQWAVWTVKLEGLKPGLYQRRHRGLIHDRATPLRVLAEFKDRGRSGEDITVQRCGENSRVAQQLRRLPPPPRVDAMEIPAQPNKTFWQPLTTLLVSQTPGGLGRFNRKRF